MNYYTYLGNEEIGREILGSEGKFINKNVKRFKQTATYKVIQKEDKFRVYTFSNFYDYKTFKLVMKRG
jgi:hypothetical protein